MAELEGRTEQLKLMFTPDEMKAINQWRQINNLRSMSAAARDLILKGLAAAALPEHV